MSFFTFLRDILYFGFFIVLLPSTLTIGLGITGCFLRLCLFGVVILYKVLQSYSANLTLIVCSISFCWDGLSNFTAAFARCWIPFSFLVMCIMHTIYSRFRVFYSIAAVGTFCSLLYPGIFIDVFIHFLNDQLSVFCSVGNFVYVCTSLPLCFVAPQVFVQFLPLLFTGYPL